MNSRRWLTLWFSLFAAAAVAENSYDISDPCYTTPSCYSVTVGARAIDVSRLAPYRAVWTQTVMQQGEWVMSPMTFEESLLVGDDGHWHHLQTIRRGEDVANTGRRVLDADTLQLRSLTVEIAKPAEGQPASVHYDMTGDQFHAEVTMPDGNATQGGERTLAMPMFDGQIAGLAIAALPLAAGYQATIPTVIPNLGTFWMEITVSGPEQRQYGGGNYAAWVVGTKWLNLTDGDIYPAGRSASGGAYYVAVNPGQGVPYVLEYANDSGVIAWDGKRMR